MRINKSLSWGLTFLLAACTHRGSPRNAEKTEAFFQIGLSFMEEGRYPEAVGKFEEAYAMDPRRYEILMHSGMAYMRMERWEEAVSKTSTACKSVKVYPECWNNLSLIYIKKGDARRAKDAAQKALDTNTYATPEIALSNLAQAELMLGENLLAKQHLDRAIRLKPDSCVPRLVLGKTWLRLNDPEEAVRALKLSVNRCPLQSEPHLWQAYAYYKLGQPKSSKRKYEQIIELFRKGSVVDQARGNLEKLQKRLVLNEPQL